MIRVNYTKYIPTILILGGFILYYSQDSLYFFNGTGGHDWQIGNPLVQIGNAHQTRSLPELRAFALQLVNRDRALNGLSPLVEASLLSQSAQGHARDMMERGYYAHTTPEGMTPTDRLNKIGGTGGVGENIMYLESFPGNSLNFRLLEKFQRSWMYSDGHRGNLLNSKYRYFGYGIAVDSISREVYAVQNFQ